MANIGSITSKHFALKTPNQINQIYNSRFCELMKVQYIDETGSWNEIAFAIVTADTVADV